MFDGRYIKYLRYYLSSKSCVDFVDVSSKSPNIMGYSIHVFKRGAWKAREFATTKLEFSQLLNNSRSIIELADIMLSEINN